MGNKLIRTAIICAAATLFAPCLAVAQHPATQAQALRPFEFKGLKAGQIVDPASVADCAAPLKNGEIDCHLKDNTIAGYWVTSDDYPMSIEAKFYSSKLSIVLFKAEAVFYSDIAATFTDKYGPPCKIDHPKWQSEGGTVFDNTVMMWCFATGALFFKEKGEMRDVSQAVYLDDNRIPKPKPTVDF